MHEVKEHYGHIMLYYQLALMERYSKDDNQGAFIAGYTQTASFFGMTYYEVLYALRLFCECPTRWKLK